MRRQVTWCFWRNAITPDEQSLKKLKWIKYLPKNDHTNVSKIPEKTENRFWMKSSGKRDFWKRTINLSRKWRILWIKNTDKASAMGQTEGGKCDAEKYQSLELSCRTLRFHLTAVQVVVFKKTRHVIEDVDQGTLLPFFQEGERV